MVLRCRGVNPAAGGASVVVVTPPPRLAAAGPASTTQFQSRPKPTAPTASLTHGWPELFGASDPSLPPGRIYSRKYQLYVGARNVRPKLGL